MKTKNVWLYVVAVLAGLATPLAAEAACPYSSLQVRVQPNTQTAWGQNLTVTNGTNVHVGVFYNGSGVPVANGSVDLYAIEGSLSILISTGWDTWWNPGRKSTWTFQAYCHGGFASTDSSRVTWN